MKWKVIVVANACAPARPTLRSLIARSATLRIAPSPPADYGFEYSDEEPEEEDVDIENQYYNSKGAMRCGAWRRICLLALSAPTPHGCTCAGMLEGEDPREALEGFKQVLKMEQDKGEW